MTDATPDDSAVPLTPIQRTFFPFATSESERAVSQSMRLAYYTKAETALKILQHREIWLRHTSAMNDVEEIDHGRRCTRLAWDQEEGKRLQRALNSCHPGITHEIERNMDEAGSVFSNAYVACFSEHAKPDEKNKNKPKDEDEIGRLSMWRAYGGSSGVALVIKAADIIKKNLMLPGLTLSPVRYAGRDQSGAAVICEEFGEIAGRVETQTALIKQTPRVDVINRVLEVLVTAVICTKHHAFSEEQEWRLVWIALYPLLPQIESRVVAVGGLPQQVFCLKLFDYPSLALGEQSVAAMVDRILIGPCHHSMLVADALTRAMIERGVAEPNVIDTRIPLRL